jgi:hypothetical protein
VVVYTALDRALTRVLQALIDHHLGLFFFQPHHLAVNVTVVRFGVRQFLRELDGIALSPDHPLAGVNYLVREIAIVVSFDFS